MKSRDEFKLDVKRFHVPFIIKYKCPGCGQEIEKDLTKQYLSFPIINNWNTEVGFCVECGCEFFWEYKLNLSLETKNDSGIIIEAI